MRILCCLALLAAGFASSSIGSAPAAAPIASAPAAERTIVQNPAALARLRRNSGITLQWISFESPARGHVRVTDRAGLVHLSGSQSGNGELRLEGDVLSIDATSFTFRGTISIVDTPDPGRNCLRDGLFEFRVTQRRRYWRLQQMEACDGLTDYVDIYF